MKGFLIFLAMIIVGGAGYLLYLDYNKPSTSVQNSHLEPIGLPIGLIEAKENDVQRQSSENPTWENIENLAPLFSGDTIKTQKSSTTSIKTNDGLVTEVRENTLVNLQKSEDGPVLDLKVGEIFSQNASPAVEFSSRGAIIKGEIADFHITTDGSGNSRVEVTKGKIFIVDKKNKRVNLSQNGSVDLIDGVITQVPKAAPVVASSTPNTAPRHTPSLALKPVTKLGAATLDLLRPETGATLNLGPENDNIEFAWSYNGHSKFFVIELSNSSDFKKIIQSDTVKSSKDKIKNLKAQGYFWRVRPFGSKNELLATSKPNFFNLKLNLLNLPELVIPAAEITWTAPSPIEFTWKKMNNAAKYRLSISTDLNQHNEVNSQVTDTNSYVWNWQSSKSYYWMVKGLNSRGTVISQSEVRHLTIRAPAKEKSPTFMIISPKDQTEVTRDLTVENPEPINFQWRVTKTLPGPLALIISSDPEFKDPMTLKNITKSLIPVTLKKEGIYYWNLSSQSEDGRDLELSPVITFNLKPMEVLSAPKIVEPANESKIESDEAKPVKFSWMPEKNATRYHLILKKIDPKTNEAFIILDRMVKETTLTSEPLEVGSYSWNLYSQDAKEKEKGADHDYTFEIKARFQMDSPKLKEPIIK